ncbi:NAD(P)H-dependent oxidoreductase subunit E [Colwellia sp. 4_MG-2023]|jgi:formate dehydrogenase subunit gamma|uniref:NAD(P)H-dependent oxidoreductase subunit E n=1 Tax=unclassified Colwellia TaxID=196834 RepID=UPI001C08292E|nr:MULTISPECIES: NAD(P)H-dependent oxidoreductase subunit E [unclassified Colwellia]MBU2926240.1 NAD(P)H-dependent oxidoreductase subunit E [Colwellia sp. C2M11]MDO6508486.1 NAD(P)H-dependent oxidoreductase subunit E [Colwellia sp. 5_MG-2023]MDO6557101.1 NAD(P)H-dependent oxidoreductase subunit E [Colwellia sp. 4_MG-2023]MDO6652338.1 NAD(P)H-dependent oxidoreductase subunit E [Colwellia sp. 3_MG-2023]MDO6666902.1 NAD(P)H-dependent oxidoreductase subunit E [Colwellia sp. 2_MG-2023]
MQIELSSPLSSVENIIDSLKNKKGSLLPILHAIQKEVGYIAPQAIERIATKLKQTPAEIHGVISFYHQFRIAPPSDYQIQICRAEACQSRGSRQLEEHAKDLLNIDYHEMTNDKKFSLDSVYCLGNCATGPNIRVNDDLHGRISNEKFEQIIANLNSKSK